MSESSHNALSNCRVCGARMNAFMSFGCMPIANGFLTAAEIPAEYYFELAPAFCESCTMFQLVEHADGLVLWANLHLLFWLSLFPFTTAWLDDSKVAETPTVLYGINLLAAAIAYFLLQQAIFRTRSGDRLREALGADWKGKWSPVLYLAGIALAFVDPWLGLIPIVAVALLWLVPDRRVERYLQAQG